MISSEKRTFKIAGQQHLVPGSVFATKPKSGKFVFFEGRYYSFGTSLGGAYPLELYVALVPELEHYDIVFVRDVAKEVWAGVFLGTVKNTIIVPNDTLLVHLRRHRVVNGARIAIINAVIELDDLDDVMLVSIEKEPRLMDPSKRTKSVTLIGAALLMVATTIAAIEIAKASIRDEVAALTIKKDELEARMNAAVAASNKQLPMLPNDEMQERLIAQIERDQSGKIPSIKGGGVMWQ